MKRFIICIVILAMIILTATGIQMRLHRSVNTLCDAIDAMIDAAPVCTQTELLQKAESISALWDKEAAFLHMVEIHRTLELAEQTLEGLPQLVIRVSEDELILKCIEAKQQLQNMARSERILPENIF